MTYEPPPGRDALGNVVLGAEEGEMDLTEVSVQELPPDEATVETQRREALKADATWAKVADEWGQTYWKNKVRLYYRIL
jgi:hypothetical protein